MGVGGQHHAPAALPPRKTRYPLYRRLGGPQGRSGRGRKISPPPGFDPRIVQPIASRYTNYAIPAPIILTHTINKYKNLLPCNILFEKIWVLSISPHRDCNTCDVANPEDYIPVFRTPSLHKTHTYGTHSCELIHSFKTLTD